MKKEKSKSKQIISSVATALDRGLGKLTDEVLAMYYASPLTFSQSRRQIYGLMVRPKGISKKRLYDTADRLSKQGWLDKKVVEDKIYYQITKKGRVRYLQQKLRLMTQQTGEQATVLIFDIPEEKRSYRNFLRRLLKQMKFTMIQRSVFISPNLLPREFYDLLSEMKLLSYIKVIEGKVRF